MARVTHISEYNRKRNFDVTREPRDERPHSTSRSGTRKANALQFVIQKHDARRLHYDFRLELAGTLKSWAVPKGPSLDPKDKRLAVHVEDHPLDYAAFEGAIPAGQYGAGDVIVWDRGIWQPHGDAAKAYRDGKLKFTLIGEKLQGDWALVRTQLRGSGGKEQWLLIKERDDTARNDYDIVTEQPASVLSGPPMAGDNAGLARERAGASPASVVAKPRRVAKIPRLLAPQLATLVDKAPAGDHWLYEIKFDGYRIMARITNGEVRLFTRNGNDWTARLQRQADEISKLALGDSWLDGEMVVLNDKGLPDFQALQNAFDAGSTDDIHYCLFDAPFLNGYDMRHVPVQQRRAVLEQVLEGHTGKTLHFSAAFEAVPGDDVLASACEMSLEGVIGKRIGSVYSSRRSAEWIKLKCRQRQEFVIVGYTAPRGNRSGFGALLLAVNDDEGLRYAGMVGTGFSTARLQQLHRQLRDIEHKTPPLASQAQVPAARGVKWVKPQLIAEVEFAEWTRAGLVRQAVFIALRDDKPADAIVREKPGGGVQEVAKVSAAKEVAAKKTDKAGVAVAGVIISHPERVIDGVSGTTKQALAKFYQDIAEFLLPQLDGRPVSIVRAPDGIAGERFFQKHAEHLSIPDIKLLDRKLDPGHAPLMEIDSVAALIGAAQMNAIEFHTWNATADRIETPDRFVLDLDPDPNLPWRAMLEATQLTLTLLDELGLDAYIKTSGGKGMHVVVPLARRDDWDSVKRFAQALSRFMARQLPERFTATMGPKNRIGKIFIDYLRNNRGASTVAAYSVRALPGLPVSVPLAREELATLRASGQWTIHNLHQRLDALKGDPWRGYAHRQRITRKLWERVE